MKPLVMILGFVSALLILAQLTMGQLILSGHDPKMIKMHQHSGYLTVVVSLVYIVISMIAVASMPRRREP
jgi:tetrahydromethanopterin S-methyltransferase subunit D